MRGTGEQRADPRQVGDHVSEIVTGDGSTIRVVFESKKRKRMTMHNIRDELDATAGNRGALTQ